ncbi:hypothetical protein AVW11_34880 [Streptomyces amritsarensis]|uniref:Secreted protein n=1 Tax=Streptomyces amritsarensis TaxID=681158 RepID=A0ABX3FUV3_9ACTN|nr:hypothetical protein AVW11_34880 [Streptomyces amritsarensis]
MGGAAPFVACRGGCRMVQRVVGASCGGLLPPSWCVPEVYAAAPGPPWCTVRADRLGWGLPVCGTVVAVPLCRDG